MKYSGNVMSFGAVFVLWLQKMASCSGISQEKGKGL